MIRKIIKIDENKCNGCGLCIDGCHEGALKLIDGKAKLVKDSFCDGLGACLPQCPTNALQIIEREADEFDEEEVSKNISSNLPTFTCPSTIAKEISRKEISAEIETVKLSSSQLKQWPCQIKLVPTNAKYFDNSHLLIAADCSAYSYANFHNTFMKNKVTIIGCPKLDNTDYSEKLSQIIKNNNIKSITIVKMEVPCCNGLLIAVKNAIKISDKLLPWNVVTISISGEIIDD